ncbi:MAG: Spx/MgsR family RNA polymerase-binding regulatory protein [Streptococcaceae bacterium]|jgi:regulatory protein spx|nr:Spx/MgsR family RNA polymerase-binding regulatory protein [Streptococcaceae bacterium]
MVLIYTVPSCSSCKKAEEWFQMHEIPYKKINLLTDDISPKDFLKILSLTEEGTEEIISKRSKAYQRLNINFDTVTVDALIALIEDNRTLLRRPLIVDDTRLQVGYNDDDIRKFLPRDFRKVKLAKDSTEIRKIVEIREAKERELELSSQNMSFTS